MKDKFSTTSSSTRKNDCLSAMAIIINLINEKTNQLENAFSQRRLSVPQFYHDLQHFSYTISEPSVLTLYKQSITLLYSLYQKELENRSLKPDLSCIKEWNQINRQLMSKEIATLYLQSYPDALKLQADSKNVLPGTFTGHLLYTISTVLPHQAATDTEL